jgi:hypothetical protein
MNFFLILSFILLIGCVIGLWKIFIKAGYPGWYILMAEDHQKTNVVVYLSADPVYQCFHHSPDDC